jgi:hypothetical protein
MQDMLVMQVIQMSIFELFEFKLLFGQVSLNFLFYGSQSYETVVVRIAFYGIDLAS